MRWPRPIRFTPAKTRYPLHRTLGGPQGRSGQVQELAPTDIRSPNRLARSESLYRPSYPGRPTIYIYIYLFIYLFIYKTLRNFLYICFPLSLSLMPYFLLLLYFFLIPSALYSFLLFRLFLSSLFLCCTLVLLSSLLPVSLSLCTSSPIPPIVPYSLASFSLQQHSAFLCHRMYVSVLCHT